jgi:small subunit ribosomal protein S9
MVNETPDETPDVPTEAPVDAEAAPTETPVESEAETPVEPEAAPTEESAPALTLGDGPAAEIESEGTEEVASAPVIRGKVDRFGVAMGTGRRKTAVARVRVKQGNGQLTINGRALEDYFKTERDQQDVRAPLRATDSEGKVDVWVRVQGGGTTGQAGAVVLGIARALQVMDETHHHTLSGGGYLTRDGRMVERKKYGFKKARKSFQFSKR